MTSNQVGKKATSTSARNNMRQSDMHNITSTPAIEIAADSSGTATASWVFITIGLSVAVLVVLLTVLVCLYRRRRRCETVPQTSCKIKYEASTTGLLSDNWQAFSSENISTEKSKSPVSRYNRLDIQEKGDPLCVSSNLVPAIHEDIAQGSPEMQFHDLPHVIVKSRSPEPHCNSGHALLPSCLSPCLKEEEDSVERAMSSISFFSSQRGDDGNKLRGGNGDFHRRYVDVDYVHNDIDPQRQTRRNRNSGGWEQDSNSSKSNHKKSVSHSSDREQRLKGNVYRSAREYSRNSSNTSSSARSYISIPPTSPSENYIEAGSMDTSLRSERSTPPTKMTWLTKNLKVDAKNEITNYQSNSGTQTESDNDITAPKCKTVFGTPWQFGGTFTSRGGTMQAQDSDVCLVVVNNAVAKGEYIDIFGSVFTDTTDIRKKLDFPARESLITPVVEYHAVPVNHFNKHVCVRLPHAMPEGFDASLIRVYTFSVDERGKVSMYTVSLCTKANDARALGAYWEKGSDGCSINIYTTHFSGYFCTLCETSTLPSICTMVFGSHVQITSSRREVRVILYIWDRRLTIKDYLERFRKQECDVDRQLLTDMQVPLLDEASSDSRLVMKMEVMGEEDERSFGDMYPGQVRKLSEIVHCCRQTDPIRVEWALENAPYQIPGAIFQCCIDIMHVDESTRDYETAMKEGSDDLMRTFYVRDLKVMTHSSQDFKPNRDVQHVDLKTVLLETASVAQTEKMCHEFGITVKDIGNFKKKYLTVEDLQAGLVEECLRRHGLDKFLNQLPNILERLRLTHVLTALESRNILFRESTDLPGDPSALVMSKSSSQVRKSNESLDDDKDTTRCKSPYRRRSLSNQRNRSSSPTYRRRSKEDSRGSQKPVLQQQMSERSDDVFVLSKSSDHHPATDHHYSRSSSRDSRQPRRHSRHSEDNEEDFSGSQHLGSSRNRYTGQNTEERQPVKNQKSSSSSRGDSVLNSNSLPTTNNSLAASSCDSSRATLGPSMIAHADPQDFLEPYSDEFLDDYLQQTYKKELAVRNNSHDTYSTEYTPYQNISDGIHLSDHGPRALSPGSGQGNLSSVSDPVPPYRMLNDQRLYDRAKSQDNEQTLQKELYGVHTVV